jgi:DNA-binding NtrC family response regulator
MLNRRGYEVLPADGPHKALEIVKKDPPVHLVISDIVMPEMQGTQLIREVVQLSPRTAIVLMTGGTIPPDVPSNVPVLKKPFSMRDLLFVVAAILEESAELRRRLRCEGERLAKTQQRSKEIYSEVAEVVREARGHHQKPREDS